MNNCPCNICPCKAICQNSNFMELIQNCELVESYIEWPFTDFFKYSDGYKDCIKFYERKTGRLKLVHKALEPPNWWLIPDEYDRANVESYTGYWNCNFIY